MGAAVVERTDLSIGVPHDDERTKSQTSGDKIIRVRDFAFVGEIGPRRAENLGHLRFENRRIGIDQTMRAILLDEMIPVIERRAAETGRRRADFL